MPLRYLIIMFFFYLPSVNALQTMKLVIPGPTPPFTVRNPFVEELLEIIFLNQNIALDLVYATESISQGRALKELNNSGLIDLTWSVNTSEREQRYTAIRLPLYQNYIGWRVFIINKQHQEQFREISSLEALSEKLAIQRFDWPDYEILLENDLNVDGDIAFAQMYKAIENGLADYFPRSVLEITRELETVDSPDLIVEKSLLLKYPSSYYFFVGKHNQPLAKIINNGFELALANGSYHELFQQHFGQALEALAIDERKVFQLQTH